MKTTDEFLANFVYGEQTGEPLKGLIKLSWESLIIMLDQRSKEVQEEQIKLCEKAAEVDYKYGEVIPEYKGVIGPPEPYVKGILTCKRVIK